MALIISQCARTCHAFPSLNFTRGVHINHIFELSQYLVKISSVIKTLMHLVFNLDFRIYLILIEIKWAKLD